MGIGDIYADKDEREARNLRRDRGGSADGLRAEIEGLQAERARLLEPMERISKEMRNALVKPMKAWETGEVIAASQVDDWADDLEAAIRAAKGRE